MNNIYLSLKRLWLLAAMLGFLLPANAQTISNYSFSTNTVSSLNRTAGSLIDDIDMNSGTTILVGGSLSNVTSGTQNIGFDFYINGTRQTLFNATSNGWVGLPTATTAMGFLSTTGLRLAPFLGATTAIGTSSIGRVHYKTVGAQPNRVLVVEFLRMAMNASTVNDTNTFQVRLYESTGAIEYVYGRMKVSNGAPLSYNVGFQFTNTAYQHVNIGTHTSSTTNSTTNTIAANGYITALDNANPGDQRSYMWTPNPPNDPGAINITNVTTTSMTLNWADASNEIGYALYRSTDGGVTYSFVSTLPANSTIFNTGNTLIANTTYNWRLYSIRESISAPSDGAATTLPASKFFTTASGDWSNPNIWNTLAVPSSQDSAEISVGHTVTLDLTSQSCGTLIVKGTLNYWAFSTNQTFTANGDVVIDAGGSFTAGSGTGPAASPFILNIGGSATSSTLAGNLIVNGTLDLSTTASAQVIFWGTQNSTLSGTGPTCEIPFITVNKGGVPTNIENTLEILRVVVQPTTPSSYTNTTFQRFSAASGTLKISAAVVANSMHQTLLNFAAAGARFWLNHASAVIGMATGATAGQISTQGEIRIDAGSVTIGTGSQSHLVTTNGTLRLNGGTFTILGGLQIANIATASLFVEGGRLVIDPQGTANLSNFTTAFMVNSLSAFTMTSGSVEVVDPHATAGGTSISIASGGVKNITGGTFIIGNDLATPSGGTFAANSGFAISSAYALPNLTIKNNISTSNSRFCRLLSAFSVTGTLTVSANGYLQTGSVATGAALSVQGNVVNNGVISGVIPGNTTGGIGSMSLDGTTAQAVSGSGTAPLLSLRIANPAGVSFTNTTTWACERITIETGSVTNTSTALGVGGTTYRGTITVGGLNESTTCGSFSNLPVINQTFGTPIYIYGPASNALQTGSFNEMPSGSLTLFALTVNDAQGLTSNRSLTITNTLTLTAGNLNMGNNTLFLGTSAFVTGTLVRTNGFVQLGATGSFTRWYSTANSPAFDYALGFPLSTGTSERSVLLSLGGGNFTTGGSLTVRHNNVIGYTDVTAFTDGVTSINRRSNSSWTFLSGSSPNIGSNTLSVRIIAASIGAVSDVTQLKLVKASSAAGGTTVDGSGTITRPEINRSFTQANISGGDLYNDFHVGTNSGINPLSPTIIAILTGNWNDVNTWEGGIIPTITNSATIAAGVDVTIPTGVTAACNGLSIAAGGSLIGSAGTLNSGSSVLIDGTLNASGTNINIASTAGTGITINPGGTLNVSSGSVSIGPSGGGNLTLTVGGTLNVTGGTLNVNGNMVVSSGSAFNQSGGDINIDMNSGSAATSVTGGTHALSILTNNLNCNAGTITIVDPPFNTISNSFALRISVAAGSLTAFSGTHTLRLGDGVSTETGGTNGFSINTRAIAGIVPLQNVTVNGGSTTGRWTLTSYTPGTGTHIKGNLIINANSEMRHTSTATYAVGGNITNNGTMTTVNTLILGGSGYVINNAQTIDGTGTFRNATSSPTGSFGALTLDNGNGLTLNSSALTYTFTGVLNIAALKITTNTNTVAIGSTGTLTRTTGYIVGNLGRNVAVGSNISRTFEIGTASDYLPVTVTYPSVTTAGIISVGINAGDHPQLATSCINTTKSINRYWRLANSGAVTTGGNYTFNFLSGDVDGGTTLSAAKLFSYDGSAWQAGITGTAGSTTFAVTGLNNYGDIAIGEITPVPTSVVIGASSNNICVGTNVLFSAVVTNGGSAPTYQWKVNGTNVGTSSTYSSTTLSNNDAVTCEIVSNSPCVVAPNATSNTITMVVSPLTVPGSVTGGTSICTGSTSGLLTLSGHTGSVVRWESSSTPAFTSPVNLNNAGNATYTSSALTATTYFRAVVQSGGCAEANSTSTTVTVDAASNGGSITGNSAICSGSSAGNLTLSGHTGTIQDWQSSTNPSFTTPTSLGLTSTVISAGSPSVTTYFRALVKNGSCPATATSPAFQITVTPSSVGGTAIGNQTICAGGTLTAISVSGHTGTIEAWQSANNASFTGATDIAGTAGLSSYTPASPSVTTYYRARVVSGSCSPAFSTTVTVTVNAAPVGGSISAVTNPVCSGNSPGTLTLSGHSGTIDKWQSNSGSGWVDVPNTSATYNPGVLTANIQFRAVLSSGPCPTVLSTPIAITVDPASVGGSVSGNQTICAGGSVTGLTLSGHTGTITRWESANNAAFTGATNLGNGGSTTYTPSPAPTSTTYYRAVITSGSCSPANSSSALITVNPASVGGTVSGSQTICAGGTVSALTLTGHTGTVDAWQSANNASFTGATDIAGTAGLTSYTPTSPSSTTYYRARITSGSCTSVNSSSATITVTPASVGGTASGDQTICSGGSLTAFSLTGQTGTVEAWQSANNASFTGATDIAGSAGLTSFTPTSPTSTTYYRARVSSGGCTAANSSTVTVTVSPASAGGSVSGNQTICSGSGVSALTLSGHTGTVTTWQSANNASFTGATDISGTAGLTSYTPSVLSATTYFRAMVASGSCSAVASSSVTITVNPTSVGGTVGGGQTICTGGSVTALTLTGQTGTVDAWQSANNAGFTGATDIAGTAGLTSYTPTSPGSTTYYRTRVSSGVCPSANSTPASITVNPTATGGTASGDQSICTGGSVTALTLTGQSGTVDAWQSANNASFTGAADISGTAGLTSYTPSSPASTTYYRAKVTNGSCGTAFSNGVTITVSAGAVAGSVTGDQTICAGGSVTALTLSGHTGTVDAWQSANNAAFTGATDISGTAGLTSYTPSSPSSTTYYRARITSGSCAPVFSSSASITVNPAAVGGTTSGTQTICSGGSVTALTLTGQTGTVDAWQSANNASFTGATDISGTAGLTSYTPSSPTASTYYRARITSGGCTPAFSSGVLITVNPGAVGGTVGGSSGVCSGSSTNLSLSGHTGTITAWQFADNAPLFNNWSNFGGTSNPTTTSALTQTTRFRAQVSNGSCPAATSNEFEVTVTSSGIWVGVINSNWSVGANWCGGVPNAATNVVIPAGTPNPPIINIVNAVANNITIDPGATLEFSGSSNVLEVRGNMTVNGTFTTTNGTVRYAGTAAQNIAGISYHNLTLSGGGTKSLSGDATVTGTLDLTSGNLQMGNFNFTVTGTALINNGGASSYIISNGTGKYTINDIGAVSTTSRTFHVGITGSYNPVTIMNTGTPDNFSVKVLDGVYSTYVGESGSSPISTNVVNKTYIINEATAGGSALGITFQWNLANELSMNRGQTIVGRYNGGTWSNVSGTPSVASGSGPYTFAISGNNVGIFGVGDVNSPLPVKLVSFNARLNNGKTNLNWTTASEVNNSHFDVERGIDGYNFERIGKVKGSGNSNTRLDYNYIDADAASLLENHNVIYYRLKQVDFSGKAEYSNAVSVSLFNNAVFEVISTVPNPFDAETNLSFKTSSISTVDVVVTDAFGKIVDTRSFAPVLGANNLTVGVDNNWAAGVYFVRISQDDNTRVVKIIKQ